MQVSKIRPVQWFRRFRRSFSEFLAVPSMVVAAFILMAIFAFVIDTNAGPREKWGPVWSALDEYVGDSDSATDLLETLAGSLITVTSITFSILLLAVQQGASSLTSQIFDQYLRRRSNQVYFGFFVGASLYAVVTLVLTNDSYRPVIGTTLVIAITAVALCILVILIHSTINQTRAVNIVDAIRDGTLRARTGQLDWLAKTSEPGPDYGLGRVLTSTVRGYLSEIDIDALQEVIADHPSARIEICLSVGDFVPAGGRLALLDGLTGSQASDDIIRKALVIDEQRDFAGDAAYGIGQLAIIGWTSTSTAKSNPSAARAVCHACYDVIWRWTHDGQLMPARLEVGRILYRDTVAEQLMDGFESLIVAASESMQHQTLGTVLHALATTFPDLPPSCKDRVENIFLISLTALGDHLPTHVLQKHYTMVTEVLAADGRHAAAKAMADGWGELAATKGSLRSRGSRD